MLSHRTLRTRALARPDRRRQATPRGAPRRFLVVVVHPSIPANFLSNAASAKPDLQRLGFEWRHQADCNCEEIYFSPMQLA